MAREVFFRHTQYEGVILFDGAKFGSTTTDVTPFTISIYAKAEPAKDVGRAVGYEGDGQMIIGMHGLRPDQTAERGLELTVYRIDEPLRQANLHAEAFSALERWLIRRGWRGNIVKKLKYSDPIYVLPVRGFWHELGFELVPWSPQWDEHVVKRWR